MNKATIVKAYKVAKLILKDAPPWRVVSLLAFMAGLCWLLR